VSSSIRALCAAAVYVGAYAVPPQPAVAVTISVVAVGVISFRAGRSTRTGVTGRLRSLVQSVHGTERDWAKTALVGGLAYGPVVGVSTAAADAFY
jgi:hypothetical protein